MFQIDTIPKIFATTSGAIVYQQLYFCKIAVLETVKGFFYLTESFEENTCH